MEKKIEDYLHLYLGCDGYYYYLNNSFSKEKLVKIDLEGRCESENRRMVISDFKPILRPLSDITREEVKEVGKLLESGFTEGVGREPSVHKYFFTPEAILWYLSKHFDLFGLIEAGLAIDATTINSKSNQP